MDIMDILTLSDENKYIITNKTAYNFRTYLCLVDINNNKNIKFCYLDKDEVVIVKKDDINETLLLKLLNSMLNELKN